MENGYWHSVLSNRFSGHGDGGGVMSEDEEGGL